MSNFSLAKIKEVTGAHGNVGAGIIVSGFSIDSRKIVLYDDIMYVALRGDNYNGHNYVNDLVVKGVRFFMVEKGFDILGYDGSIVFLVVEDTLVALQKLANYHRSKFKFPVLAITGSNGKTIVKEWIAQLGRNMSIQKSPKSYNSQVGVPLSLLLFESNSDLGIVEAGISLPGEMDRLKTMIDPDWGLITNIGQAHQENFSSIEEKLLQKVILLKGCKKVFLCSDHEFVFNQVKRSCVKSELITWGKDENAHLQIIKKVVLGEETKISVVWKNQKETLIIPFSDLASYENAMSSALVLLHQGMRLTDIKEQMVTLKPVAMRLEQIEGRRGCLIINDAYNSDITSLELALDFLEQQARKKEMPRQIVLSDMFQSGLNKEQLYYRISELLSAHGVDSLVGVGKDITSFAHLFNIDSNFFLSTTELLNSGLLNNITNRVILLKGSRDFSFEKIAEALEQKNHQTVLEVNLNALNANLNCYRAMLQPKVKLLAMVKAFSYGSGSFEIAGLLQHQRVDYLGVAFADEGVELRQAGIGLPILVMSPEKKSFPMMLQHRLEPEIYSFKILEQFASAVESEGLAKYNVHIKLDTGMNRLGFLHHEVPELIQQFKKFPSLKVKSVFTHLAGSEDEEHDGFSLKQIDTFKSCSQQLIAGVGYEIMRHVLNSAGVERFPEAQFEMVRLGIGLYGISATANSGIKNIATLKTYISQIKPIVKNQSIGYGRKGVLKADGKIAILPIGYADGLDRRLGNGNGEFLIKGKLASTVGNICMDMCMIDITHIDCNEDDEVIIFGDDLPITKLAERMNTIPYEVLTSISRRVKRIYYQE